jgi:hypothetical protein
MPARRKHTHGHPGRVGRRSRASALARLAFAATRWTALGFVLVASFWAYLGAVELIGGEEAVASSRGEAPEAHRVGCTALRLDRPSGRTRAEPCHGPALMLRETLAARLPDPAAR